MKVRGLDGKGNWKVRGTVRKGGLEGKGDWKVKGTGR